MYFILGAVRAKYFPSLIPDTLIRILGIRLKTVIKTLDTTTHQFFWSTGLLVKWFKTDKYQLQYKQLSCWCGTFCVEYLKMVVKSVRQFIVVTLYTNKLGFNKLFP